MILVEIRCRVTDCGALLASINDKVPHKVSGMLTFPACKKHPGAQREDWTQAVLAATGSSAAEVAYAYRLDLAQLRPVIAEARSKRRKQVRVI